MARLQANDNDIAQPCTHGETRFPHGCLALVHQTCELTIWRTIAEVNTVPERASRLPTEQLCLLSSRMKAAYIDNPGPPENIRIGDLPNPTPSKGQCLVRVKAVSVNPIDTYIRSGLVQMQLPFPFIVGCDLAGVIEAVGSEVKRFKPGDRVWGSNQGLMGRQGTFAEFAAVDEAWLYPTPATVRDEEAAAIALVGITAHLGLSQHVHLRPKEILFVNGGSGGVGSMVIQMAKAIGARVITTAG